MYEYIFAKAEKNNPAFSVFNVMNPYIFSDERKIVIDEIDEEKACIARDKAGIPADYLCIAVKKI